MSNITNPNLTIKRAPVVFRPTNSRQPLILGVSTAFIVTITIFIGVRLYIRGFKMRKAWKIDDTMFILSSIITIAQCVVIQLSTIYGLTGQHIWMLSLSLSKIRATSIYSGISLLAYNISFGFIKATFLLQYRRAFGLPSIKQLCDILLGILLMMSVALLLTTGVVMREMLRGNILLGPTATSGISATIYITGAAHLLSDIVIFILPMVLLCQVRLTTTQKIGLYASFGVGILTSVISIFKIVTVREAFTSKDPLYKEVPVTILSIAEPTSAIVFACVPLMRPLLCCSGTSRDSSNSSNRPLTSATESYADQMRLRDSLQPQSPESLRIPTYPPTVRIIEAERITDEYIESYHESMLVGGRVNRMSPYTRHPSTPTKS